MEALVKYGFRKHCILVKKYKLLTWFYSTSEYKHLETTTSTKEGAHHINFHSTLAAELQKVQTRRSENKTPVMLVSFTDIKSFIIIGQ